MLYYDHCICHHLDFSDSVNRQAQSGFRVQPSEFEGVSGEREVESVMQRYLRLKEEVGLLVSDVEHIKESQENSEKLLQVSPADLLHDVSAQLYCKDISRTKNAAK